MEKKYRILIFGKDGCPKCKTLKERLHALLERSEFAAFDAAYCDVLTEEGLVQFAKLECLNPARIPAFVILERRGDEFVPVARPTRAMKENSSLLSLYLGLQTDYSTSGVLTPQMLESVLEEARA
jgi:hypothetical protein